MNKSNTIMKKLILLFSAIISIQYGMSQGLGIGANQPHPSAELDVNSITRGMLIPRMTSVQRAAIVNPAAGLLVFQTDNFLGIPFSLSGLYIYETANAIVGWKRIAKAEEVAGGTNSWTVSGANQFSGVTGNVGIGTTNPAAKLHVADSSVVFSANGIFDSDHLPPISGAGRRMMWYPARGAFRVGYVEGTNWDKESTGSFSFANGYNTKAIGYSSTAMGKNTIASGLLSTAMGNSTNASGESSTSMGVFSNAYAYGSTTTGGFTNAKGIYSFATGDNTFAKARSSLAIGFYNDTTDNPNIGITALTDRIFQIGNGIANNVRSNALTVLANGNTGLGITDPNFRLDIAGRMRIRSGGDINNSAGFFLNNTDNTDLPAFIGMEGSTQVGFYGKNSGWSFIMNTDNGNIGMGTVTPNASAQLDISSITKGFLPPRMTTTQRNAIPSPTAGLTIYNTSNNTLQVYNGTSWFSTNSTQHFIGENYGGGIVFYVYDNGQHGLIAATSDQSFGHRWYGGSNTNTRARADGVGGGLKNTAIIIANQGAVDGNPFAATLCNEYSSIVAGVTYGDWYLPSKHELNLLYLQKTVVGATGVFYWSSSEIDNVTAWLQSFSTGAQLLVNKTSVNSVRAIRAF